MTSTTLQAPPPPTAHPDAEILRLFAIWRDTWNAANGATEDETARLCDEAGEAENAMLPIPATTARGIAAKIIAHIAYGDFVLSEDCERGAELIEELTCLAEGGAA